MSSKRGFLNRSAALAAGVGFAALMAVALTPPAMADDEGGGKHHHRGHYDYDGPGYVVAPGYVYGGYYAGPPAVYYQPPPVYVVAPPPMVYAPPPVYYAPPGLSLGINIPLH
jgi:hypothetical protein